MENNYVRFVSCTQEQYNSIYNKDQNIEEQSDTNNEKETSKE